ncbi:SWIM zinc finger family protein [Iamia sp.]|uniref:SWIM zinc finger family protein n=1 Tax=Iamia sp. TaxID=2722710 RepID=UPI002BF0C14B|nr:SWIM zinc finger family protein [Iamia sp.]HXH59364.1 SWIM zinc finger family protein [Iamia sp.]
MARRFGQTWWGRAWIDALENRARLDPNRLPRGRTYARHDRVSNLHLAPGEITAFVRGNRPGRYRVLIRVRTYGDAEWDRVVATIAGRAGHAAALLEGELDPSIAEDATQAGVDLMPGPGDLQPRCTCPDWADPCKHAAAVCYLVADALDDDPFTLFAVRGRPRDALLAELRAHRRAGSSPQGATGGNEGAGSVPADDGEVARDVWRRAAERRAEAADRNGGTGAPTPSVPARPGAPAMWPTDPPDGAPFTAEGLHVLAADAAERAWAQLRGEADAGLGLDADADLARRAAVVLGRVPEFAALARSSGTAPVDLARRAIAWRHGGYVALAVLDEDPWRPPVAAMVDARAAVVEALPTGAKVAVSSNRITAGPVQLRLDRAGRWWRFEKRRGRWEITAPGAEHPDDLVTIQT